MRPVDRTCASGQPDTGGAESSARTIELELRAVDLDGGLLDSTILRLADRAAEKAKDLEIENPGRHRRIQALLR